MADRPIAEVIRGLQIALSSIQPEGTILMEAVHARILCNAAEQNATTLAESVRVATEELRGRLEDAQFEYRECLRTRSDLLHERNTLRTERDALRQALHAIVTRAGDWIPDRAAKNLREMARAALVASIERLERKP